MPTKRRPTTKRAAAKPAKQAAKAAKRRTKPARKTARKAAAKPAVRKPRVQTTVILGTTEQPDGDWQLPKFEQRLGQLERLVSLRHRHRPERAIWTDQPHGTRVIRVEQQETGSVGAADGLVTNEPDVLLTVRTADCVPIFLISERSVGILHAGMAGTVEGILPRGIRAMKRHFGVRPERLTVRFGPHICRSCYRLSENNDAYLREHPEAEQYVSARGHHRYFSMLDMLSEQAAALGVERLEADNRCTFHSAGLFSSRRGHGDQRLLSYVMLGSTASPATAANPIASGNA